MTAALRFIILAALLMVESYAGSNAGIVLYHRDGDAVSILMADHTDDKRGWAAFGGSAEAGETSAQTAARETEEETRGYFKRGWLLKKIEGQKPADSNGFKMYFVEVPKVDVAKIVAAEVDPDDNAFAERKNYAWIPFSEIVPLIDKKDIKLTDLTMARSLIQESSRSKTFWLVCIRNFQDAKSQNAIPWQQKRAAVTR